LHTEQFLYRNKKNILSLKKLDNHLREKKGKRWSRIQEKKRLMKGEGVKRET
jgi:hypothetical protein